MGFLDSFGVVNNPYHASTQLEQSGLLPVYPIGSSSRMWLNQCTHCKGGRFQGLPGLPGLPGRPAVDQLGLVQAVDRLGQGVVVAVVTAAHRRFYAGLGQPLGVAMTG